MKRRAQSGASCGLPCDIPGSVGRQCRGGLLLFNASSDQFRTLRPLDVAAYLENANSLRGNTYKIDGKVANLLGWTAGNGRLVAFEVKNPEGTGSEIIPTVVPAKLNEVNFQKEARFQIKVKVEDRGILYVQELTKS